MLLIFDGRNGTIAMKLGGGNWSPQGTGWTLRTSGTDYAVWTKGGTVTPPPPPPAQVDPFTVNFKKPASWNNNVNVYLFDASTNAIIPGTSVWPGQSATNISGTPWYSLQVNPPSGVAAQNIRVIFNDGTNQTDDLARSTTGWYDNGSWSNTCPSDCNESTNPPTGTTNFTVNFKKPNGWGNTVNAYFFDAGANATIPGTAGWPGQQTTNISGTPWYSFEVTIPSGTTLSNVRVIFNDGNNQTDDLARGSTGWYDNGTWTNTCPSDCDGNTNPNPPTTNDVTFYFLKNSSWGNTANVYLYNTNTNSTLSGTPGWPGAVMQNQANSSWSSVSFALPNNVSANNVGVVFNNGNGQQTVDLTRGTSGWFRVTGSSSGKATGVWSNNCPTGCLSQRQALITNDNVINFENSVRIAPNPITQNGNLFVTTKEKGILKVAIINLLGQSRTIYEENNEAGNHTIQLKDSDFGAKGIYIISTTLDNKNIVKPIKVIKQ